jgi:Skp family chaperone for outer membrane proteins
MPDSSMLQPLRPLQRLLASAFLFVGIALGLSAGDAQAQSYRQKRLALVVGNDTYPASPLKNSSNDARSMDRALRAAGFEVSLIVNADLRTLTKEIKGFIGRIDRGDIALFYYSGHGMQIYGENFLQPIDFEADDLEEAKYHGYSVQLVQSRMEARGAELNILILDACRDNPFRALRSSVQGLAAMSAGRGTFLAFATGPGGTASDNPGETNGLFTKYLVQALRRPGLRLDEIFNEVRTKVYLASNGHQVPWTSSSVIGEFSFLPSQNAAKMPEGPANIDNEFPLLPSQNVANNAGNREVAAMGQPDTNLSAEAAKKLVRAKDEALSALDEKVMPVINAAGSANQLVLIFRKFESGLLYCDNRVDVTTALIAQFDSGISGGLFNGLPETTRIAVVDTEELLTKSREVRSALTRLGKTPREWKIDPGKADEIDSMVARAISEIGRVNQITYIFAKFESGLIFAVDAVDITGAVVQQLDTRITPTIHVPAGRIHAAVIDTARILSESRMGREALESIKRLSADLAQKPKEK